jgi:hypothetical protein
MLISSPPLFRAQIIQKYSGWHGKLKKNIFFRKGLFTYVGKKAPFFRVCDFVKN